MSNYFKHALRLWPMRLQIVFFITEELCRFFNYNYVGTIERDITK